MKTKFLLFFVFLSSFTFGQKSDSSLLRSISKQEAQQDLDSLVKWVDEIHPNMYEHIEKDQFRIETTKMSQNISENINVRDFYVLIAPLLSKMKDAHTEFHLPFIIKQERKDLFPFIIHLSTDKKLYVKKAINQLFVKSIPVGAELISINKIDVKKIIEETSKLISYETQAFYKTRFEDLFSSLLFCRFGIKETFEVEFKSKNKIYNVNFTNNQFIINSNNNEIEEYNFKTLKKNKFCLLTINSFGVKDENDFNDFLKISFKKMNKLKIPNLIIDLRLNDGGNSELGDNLLTYLSKKPFMQYDTTYFKYSRLQKQLHIKMNKNDTIFSKKMNKYPNGFIEKRVSSILINPLNSNLQYQGKIFLCISNYTFSAAADFAWAFKNYNLGTIVGQETGGLGVCFGDGIQFILPNSKISGQASCQKFYNIGAKKNDFRGVIPDIETKENDELKKIYTKFIKL